VSPRRSSGSSFGSPFKLPFEISARRLAAFIAVAVVALALFGLVFDVANNFGRIHKGVTMQGADVGGLTRADAAVLLQEQLGASVDSAPVDLFANEQLASEGFNDQTVDLTHASTTYGAGEGEPDSYSWRITAATVGASVDGEALAEKAYAVGRGKDFFPGRIGATLFGVEVEAFLTYTESQLEALESLIGDALGWDEKNADINFENGEFVVVPSSEGYGVNRASLVAELDRALLGAQRSLVVPMSAILVDISNEEAAEVAALAQEAVALPVELVYEDNDSWSLDSDSLGPWVATSIEGKGGEARLIPHIAGDRLGQSIHDIIGDRDPGIQPQNARFEATDDAVTIVPSENGAGIDYERVAADLTGILFLADDTKRDRRVALAVTTLEPALTTAQAEAMRITEKFASYTTEYTVASGAKVTNIHLAADLLNNSLIEPGGVWSFNDTAGECNAERGFQEATSIVEGEYVDEIGGGICQVATTVYNAVFDSGLPIAERVNHGFYLVAYPAGRDATVSWRWPDLKFENDTENWMLLTMSYTDNTVTCALWGTDPGYKVVSEDTGFTDRTDFKTKEIDNPELSKGEERVIQEGVRGRTIIVTRYVYNSAGTLLRKTDFKSIYEPETEIIEVGTKEEPEDAEEDKDAEKPAEDA
jgi:vancomycin resistance protein YoaR